MSIRALAATAVALTLTATPACADSTAGLESTDTLTVLTMNAHGSTIGSSDHPAVVVETKERAS